MIKRQVFFVVAVLAGKAIAQKHVEAGEGWIERRLDVGLERNNARQLDFETWASNGAIVFGDDVDAIKEHSLDRFLPAPERQRVVAQWPEVGIQNQGRKRFRRGRMSVHNVASCRFSESGGHRPIGRRILAVDVNSVKAWFVGVYLQGLEAYFGSVSEFCVG